MSRPAPRPAPASRRTPAQRPAVKRTAVARAGAAQGSASDLGDRMKRAGLTVLGAGFLLLTVFAPPAALLAFLGSLPTVFAWIAEAPERRGISAAVGALNLAGVGLAVFFFLAAGGETARLPRYIAQPAVWVGMYGSAAVGWGLFLTIPPVVQAADRLQRRKRLGELRRFRRRLTEEWGDEISGRARPGPPQDPAS